MATFQGGDWIAEQLLSILPQLDDQDELIIVDDASSDTTLEIIREIAGDRATVMRNARNLGHLATFERAIRSCRGEYVFLADQDDVWLPGRLTLMLESLSTAEVIATSFEVLRSDGRLLPGPVLKPGEGRAFALRNLVGLALGRRPYFGCAMAFRREVLPVLVPFPRFAEAHDQWLAVVGNVDGFMSHVNTPTLTRRLHGANLSRESRRPLKAVLKSRVLMLGLVIVAARRRAAGQLRPDH